jgi:GNAT superfamily N-acetyltransferase
MRQLESEELDIRNDDLLITYIAVEPARTRRGIGAELIAFAYLWAKAQGKKRLLVDVPANSPARDFFEREGFVKRSTRDAISSLDLELVELHLMEKPL